MKKKYVHKIDDFPHLKVFLEYNQWVHDNTRL